MYGISEDVPSVLTVLNTAEVERNTEQQGQSRLVCCYFKFHALAIIRQHEDGVPTRMPVYMPHPHVA